MSVGVHMPCSSTPTTCTCPAITSTTSLLCPPTHTCPPLGRNYAPHLPTCPPLGRTYAPPSHHSLGVEEGQLSFTDKRRQQLRQQQQQQPSLDLGSGSGFRQGQEMAWQRQASFSSSSSGMPSTSNNCEPAGCDGPQSVPLHTVRATHEDGRGSGPSRPSSVPRRGPDGVYITPRLSLSHDDAKADAAASPARPPHKAGAAAGPGASGPSNIPVMVIREGITGAGGEGGSPSPPHTSWMPCKPQNPRHRESPRTPRATDLTHAVSTLGTAWDYGHLSPHPDAPAAVFGDDLVQFCDADDLEAETLLMAPHGHGQHPRYAHAHSLPVGLDPVSMVDPVSMMDAEAALMMDPVLQPSRLLASSRSLAGCALSPPHSPKPPAAHAGHLAPRPPALPQHLSSSGHPAPHKRGGSSSGVPTPQHPEAWEQGEGQGQSQGVGQGRGQAGAPARPVDASSLPLPHLPAPPASLDSDLMLTKAATASRTGSSSNLAGVKAVLRPTAAAAGAEGGQQAVAAAGASKGGGLGKALWGKLGKVAGLLDKKATGPASEWVCWG